MLKNAKEKFAESLRKLLGKKMLDHITIKDIVEDCGVSRQTFYYYFTDIYQIVEWVYTNLVSEALNNNRSFDTWQQVYCCVHENMRNEKLLLTSACRSIRREFLESFMYKVMYDIIYPMVDVQARGIDVDRKNKEFVARFYCLAFVAMDLDWVQNGMKEDPAEITEAVATLLKGSFRKALENCAQ